MFRGVLRQFRASLSRPECDLWRRGREPGPPEAAPPHPGHIRGQAAMAAMAAARPGPLWGRLLLP